MAAWRFKPPIERVRSGYRINLDQEERDVLVRLLGELRSLLVGPNDSPTLARLFPTAYHLPEHAGHDDEYQRLMREELVASRLTGIEIVLGALTETRVLDESKIMALLQAVNGVRLVLGTILDVSEELDLEHLPEDHPQLGEFHLYGYLSWLLEWTVRALSQGQG